MRQFVKTLSAGERFSAIVIALAFFSVIIPAAIAYTHSTAASAQTISRSHGF
jgi:hypothetical protein